MKSKTFKQFVNFSFVYLLMASFYLISLKINTPNKTAVKLNQGLQLIAGNK